MEGVDPRIVDGALVVALAIPPGVAALVAGQPLALITAALLTVPLYFRRRMPLLVFAIQVVGIVTAGLIAPPVIAGSVTIVAAILVGAYSAGAHSSFRWLSLTLVGGPAVLASVAMSLGPTHEPPWVLLVLVPWLMGVSVR